jgi:arginine/ornithine N-succinyltransferase beta subunit
MTGGSGTGVAASETPLVGRLLEAGTVVGAVVGTIVGVGRVSPPHAYRVGAISSTSQMFSSLALDLAKAFLLL